jgi:hypothetical protein
MGWSYEERRAYGVIIDAANNTDAWKDIVRSNSTMLSMSEDMAEQGYDRFFVYLNSTYETLSESDGSYAYGSAHERGLREFWINEKDRQAASLTDAETKVWNTLREACVCESPIWIRQAKIWY